MRPESEARAIINDLDTIALRIEALPVNPYYSAALASNHATKKSMAEGAEALHHRLRNVA